MTRCLWNPYSGSAMNIGDVIYNPDFVFTDGGHADKIFIIISDATLSKIVMVMVTSKGKDAKNKGCQPKPKKYLFKQNECGFKKDTWIDLSRSIYAWDTDKVQASLDSQKTKLLGTIPEQRVNEIRNCLTKHAIESLNKEACELLGVKPKW